MRKKVFQVLVDLTIALLATVVIAVFSGVSFIVLIDNVTWMSIVLFTYIVIDDPVYLLFNNKKLLNNKPYLFGIGLYLLTIILFEAAYFNNNSLIELILLVLSVISFVGATVFAYKQYKNPLFSCVEKQRLLMAIIRDKIKDGMPKATVERELSHLLKFRIEGNNLEGVIDVVHPFLNENDTLYTLADMISANKDGKMDARIVETTGYIKNLADTVEYTD